MPMSPNQKAVGIPRQTSSFLSTSATRPLVAPSPKKWPPQDEIIPDSEEEHIQEEKAQQGYSSTDDGNGTLELSSSSSRGPHLAERSVIVISSDSDEDAVPHRSQASINNKPPSSKGKGKARAPISGIESEDDPDVICISDADTDSCPPAPPNSPVKQKILQRTFSPTIDAFEPDVCSDDLASLTFDPNVHAKPVPCTSDTTNTDPAPERGLPGSAPSTAPVKPSASKPPRKPKAVPAEQMRLQAYAREMFGELNGAVFRGGLPQKTKLVWNARLLTSAGRAFIDEKKTVPEERMWIELSPKVLDCDERVRHTLAHEMCHLAVWFLDGNIKGRAHGAHFKAWAKRVSKARPDIEITTKHNYAINYKFQWECVECGRVYGRHTDSINIEKRGCGACDTPARLKPLFEKRKRDTPKTASESKLASGSPRASPRPLDRPSGAPTTPSRSKSTVATPADSTDENDVEALIQGLGNVRM